MGVFLWKKHFSRTPLDNRKYYGDWLYEIKEDVLQNRCSQKFRNIQRKTFVLESLFNKVAGIQRGTCRFTCFLMHELGVSHISIFVRSASLMTFWNSEKLSNFKIHKLPWAVNELYICMKKDRLTFTKLVKNFRN